MISIDPKVRAVADSIAEHQRRAVCNRRISVEQMGRLIAWMVALGWTVNQTRRDVSLNDHAEFVCIATLKLSGALLNVCYTAEGSCAADALWHAVEKAVDAGVIPAGDLTWLFKEAA